jgi:hypothetical protein
MLGKSLEDSSNAHDRRTCHNGPSSSIRLVEPGRNRNSENGTKLVAGRDESEKSRFDARLVILIKVAVAEIFSILALQK